MALTSTLRRFRIDLSDIERSLYRDFDLRVAQHPSESETYMLTRLFAYLLSFEEGLVFAPGLCTDDEPAVFVRDPANGGFKKWIEIGNPSSRRLHKASKACASVSIYTYKDPVNLVREFEGEKVHRLETIRAYALQPGFLSQLTQTLARDNTWTVFRQEGDLTVVVGEESFSSAVAEISLSG